MPENYLVECPEPHALRNRHNILVKFEIFDFRLQKNQINSDIDLRASFKLHHKVTFGYLAKY